MTAVTVGVRVWRGAQGWKCYRVDFEGDVAIAVDSVFMRRGAVKTMKLWRPGERSIPSVECAIFEARKTRRLSKLEKGQTDAVR